MLLLLKSEQLGLFDMPVHVAGSIDKHGHVRAPHMSTRKKRLNPETHHAPVSHVVNRLDAWILSHGGPDHLRTELESMTAEQRAKLIDAMAHVGGVDHAAVMATLGMKAPEPPKHDIVEHVTGRGKTLRGIIRRDLNGQQAAAIDPYTFRKDGGWFIREKHLTDAEPSSAPPEPVVQSVAEPKEEAPHVDRSKVQAQKLREAGQKQVDQATETRSRDRLTNTPRRVRMARGVEEDAAQREAIGRTMMNLADAIESGEAKYLGGITTRAAVETLDDLVRSAISETDRSLPYIDQERRKGRAPTPDDIRNAKMPVVSIHRAGLLDMADKLSKMKGASKLSAWAYRLAPAAHEHHQARLHTESDMEMAREAVKKLGGDAPWYLSRDLTRIGRFDRIGIRNELDLRRALTEYLIHREGRAKADPIKEAERELVGQKVGADFFPTPKPLADRMAEMAGVKPGMSVLEPSAGHGSLADAAKSAGGDVDTIEISDALRNVLAAKGHRMVDRDFMSFEPTKRYDAVIMNPPFSDRQDAAHIQRAFEMLKPGGKLVAIAGEGVFFGSDKKAQAFRDWLEESGAEVEKLPENTFKGSDLPAQTGANARLIVIRKDESAAEPAGPKEGDTKTEDGVEYVLRDGRWHRSTPEPEPSPSNAVDIAEAREELADAMAVDPHSDRAKELVRHIAEKERAATEPAQEAAPPAETAVTEPDYDTALQTARNNHADRLELLRAQIEDMGGKEAVSRAVRTAGERGNALVTKLADAMGMSEEEIAAELGLRRKEQKESAPKPRPERAPAPVSQDEDDPNSPNYRYRDTGYVAGSRKELASRQIKDAARNGEQVLSNQIDWESIEQNPRQAKQLITKSNLFGQVDWEKLKARGMSPGAGFLIDRIYAAIGQGPSEDSPLARKDYAMGLQSLRDRLEAANTPEDVANIIDNLREEYDGRMLTAEEAAQYEGLRNQASELRRQEEEIEEPRKQLYHAALAARSEKYRAEQEIENRRRRGWAPKPELQQEFERAEKLHNEADSAWSSNISATNDALEALRKRREGLYVEREGIVARAAIRNKLENPLHRAWNLMGDRFIGVLRYRSHKGSDAFAKHVTAAKSGQVKDWSWAEKEGASKAPRVSKESARFQLKVADSHERIGGRRIFPQSTADLKNAFGLRDVQSGNWVLRDPVSAKFHTEQSAGAFADLADLLGVADQHVSLNGRLALAFGARGSGAIGWADSAPRAHYEPIDRVINITKMRGGGALAHEWFHSLDNMAKEAEGMGASGEDDYFTENPEHLPEGELRDAAVALRRAMLDGPHQRSQTFAYTARDHQLAKHNIDSIYPGSVARSIKAAADLPAALAAIDRTFGADLEGATKKQKKRASDWRQLAVAWFGGNPEGGEVISKYGRPMSSFALEAHRLDGGGAKPHYAQAHEMAARAFQSWVEDRLADQGRKNDYLSSYADNKYHVDPLLGIEWKPYPEGDERTSINAAFDRLVAAMAKSRTLAKAGLL